MTEQEAKKLKVGDMVLFYDYGNQEIKKGRTLYYEVVEGKKIPADLGLIVGTRPGKVKIDWFSEPGVVQHDFDNVVWEKIEKA